MYIKANGVNLFYQKSGQGEPLILLHGNGEDHHIFDVISSKLQNNYTVYAIDSRNHGQSEKTDEYTYEAMTADIDSFICNLQLNKVNLIGFSDGAIISLMLAIKHQEVIKKMALLGVNLSPSDFTQESYQYVKETYAKTKDPLFEMMLQQPNIELCEVSSVIVPTMLIAGENDIFKPELYQSLKTVLPKATLKIVAGHDHDSYIKDQDLLYDDLVTFLGTPI